VATRQPSLVAEVLKNKLEIDNKIIRVAMIMEDKKLKS